MALQTCKRCRRRRVKCDLQLPACGNCQQVDVECLFYDEALQQEIPRSYLHALNEKVKELEFEINNLKNSQSAAVLSTKDQFIGKREDQGYHIHFPKILNSTSRHVACFLGPGSSARLLERLLKALLEWHLCEKHQASRKSTVPLMVQSTAVDEAFISPSFTVVVDNRKVDFSTTIPPSTQRALIEHYIRTVQPDFPLLSAEQEATLLEYENPLRWSATNARHPDAQALVAVIAVSTALVSRDIEPSLLSASIAYRELLRKSSQQAPLAVPTTLMTASKQLIMTLCFLTICELINPVSGEAWGLLGRALTSMEQLRAKYQVSSTTFDDELRRLEYSLLVLESAVSSHFGRPSRFCEMWNPSTTPDSSTFRPADSPLVTYKFRRKVAQGFFNGPPPPPEYFQNLIPSNIMVKSSDCEINTSAAAFYISLHPLYTTTPSKLFSDDDNEDIPSDLLKIIANSAVAILDNYFCLNKDVAIISLWMAAERVLEAGAVWAIYLIRLRHRQSRLATDPPLRASHTMVPLQKCSILLTSFAERWKGGSIYVEVWETFLSYFWDILD